MAHANYESSTPAKGEVLTASPPQVSITFTQDVQRITGTFAIDVGAEPAGGGPAAESITAGPTVLDDNDRSIMTVPLQPNLAPGRYVVRWKNVSDTDGDSAEGAFSFYVGVQPTAEDLTADAALEPENEETPSPAGRTSTPGTTPPASSTSTPPVTGGDDDGNTGTVVAVVVALAAVVAGLAIGFFGVRWFANRRT